MIVFQVCFVDWSRLICELQAAGYSKARIARELCVHWSTVDGWLTDAEPRYSHGAALINLHEKVCNFGFNVTRPL